MPSDVDLVGSVAAVLGDVDGLSAEGPDAYVGGLDGRYRVWMTLPGATSEQLDAARSALVGARKFGLRPVTSGTVDAQACAALRTNPKPDRLCDSELGEVLTLGTDLGVVPTRILRASTEQGPQSAATLTFDTTDARKIAAYTAAHVGDRLAVTDGLGLVTAPTIQSAITLANIAISGNYSPTQAAAMIGRLQLAALGATISSDS